jgi:hypothetical protein
MIKLAIVGILALPPFSSTTHRFDRSLQLSCHAVTVPNLIRPKQQEMYNVDSAEKVANAQKHLKQLHRQRVRCHSGHLEGNHSILADLISPCSDFFSRI